MKRISMLNLGVLVAGALLTGTALAQPPSGGPGGGQSMGFGDHRPPFERAMGAPGEHGRWWNNPKVAERLKLTDTQRKAMDDTLQQHRETLVDLRGTLQKAELELEPMMKEDQPNESQILAQIDKVAQARAELEKANARFLLAIRSKLTPDQWKQVEAFRASRPPRGYGQGSFGQSHRGQAPPAGDGQDAPPPPGGPQAWMDGGPESGLGPGGPPPPQEGVEEFQ
ncbi:MAG: Spy/CpxP family protein refolding chaperone [Terracidiphilus sp.]|jgi:Spy/CpxP family protein refolding chaperone